jgi:hypothetical protein
MGSCHHGIAEHGSPLANTAVAREQDRIKCTMALTSDMRREPHRASERQAMTIPSPAGSGDIKIECHVGFCKFADRGASNKQEIPMEFLQDKRVWWAVAAIVVVLIVLAWTGDWFGGGGTTPPPTK